MFAGANGPLSMRRAIYDVAGRCMGYTNRSVGVNDFLRVILITNNQPRED